MKKYTLWILLLFPGWISAQNRQVIEAKSGDELTQKISAQIQFLFPEFTDGDVYFKGNNIKVKLNYNMLLGEMQFIEKNQVMALANAKDVLMIIIGNRKFYPFNNNEFVEELTSISKYQLMVKRSGNVIPHSKKGAYGMETSTSSITSISSIGADNRQYNLDVQEKVLITVKYYYYLLGTNGKYILIKNVKTFTKQFPSHRAQIEAFVKERKIKFDNEDDLKSLLEYCSNLSN